VIRIFLGVITALLVYTNINISQLIDRTDTIESRLANLEEIVDSGHHVIYNMRDIDCLAKNIYYEAGVEKDSGKYAIASITVNRLKTGQWGNSICGVVYSHAQFSWTLKKHLPRPDPVLYNHCYDIAMDALNGKSVRGLSKSLFYHADYIPAPKWADSAYQSMKIGSHIFYTKAKNSWLTL